MQNINIESLADEERRIYFKEWRKKNKNRIKTYNQRYWMKKARKRIENPTKGDDKY